MGLWGFCVVRINKLFCVFFVDKVCASDIILVLITNELTRGVTMTIEEIKQVVDNGEIVYWSNKAYTVIKDNRGEYYIVCSLNNHSIGLHGVKGGRFENVLNGEESDFFV